MASAESYQGEVKAPVYKLSYTFKIRDFDKLLAHCGESSKRVVSPFFGHSDTPEVTWRLHIWPKGGKKTGGDHVAVYLHHKGLSKLNAQYSLRHGKTEKVRAQRAFEVSRNWGTDTFVAHGDVEYSGPGVFEVTAEVEYVWGEAKVLSGPSGPQPSMALDFSALLFSPDLSDFALVVEGQTIPVHRNLLASASPVFKAMFAQTATAEAQSGTAVLKDTSVGAVRLLLGFAYTGRLLGGEASEEGSEVSAGASGGGKEEAAESRTSSLCGALGLSERYDVAGLGEAAEWELLGLIRQDSFVHIATAAHLHGFLNLLKACRDALTCGRVELKDWRALADAQPQLIPDLFLVPFPQIHNP